MNKAKTSREELFETMPVVRAIFTLTIPMIIGSLVSMIYNLSDTYFVGMLNDPLMNAAVTLAAPVQTLFYAVTNLFGIGAASSMSRNLGLKDMESVKKASATGIYAGLFFAALLSLITTVFNTPVLNLLGTDAETFAPTHDYIMWTVCFGAVPGIMNIMFGYLLRAEGRSMHASLGTMSGCILNIIMDPFFILPFGLNMGVAGAGLATFISNCVSCVYFIVLLMITRRTTCVCLNIKYVTFSKNILGDIFVVGTPGVFQNFLNVLSITILNNIVAVYGAEAVAAIGIANKLNQIPVQIIFGFTQGVMPLIGYNYASGNEKRMKESIFKTGIITMSALLAVLAVFVTLGSPLVRLFMDNDTIVTIGARFLKGFGISLPFMCMDFFVVGISQAFGIGKYALVFSFLRKAFLEIPIIILYSNVFGLAGLAFAQATAEAVMAVVAVFVLKKMLAPRKT